MNGWWAEVHWWESHARRGELYFTLQTAAVVHYESRFPQHVEIVVLSQDDFHLFVDARVVVLLQSLDQVVGRVDAESAGEELVELEQVDASTLKK